MAVEAPAPAARCPHCGSIQVVKKYQTITLVMYFCLACARSFDVKTHAPPAPV